MTSVLGRPRHMDCEYKASLGSYHEVASKLSIPTNNGLVNISDPVCPKMSGVIDECFMEK